MDLETIIECDNETNIVNNSVCTVRLKRSQKKTNKIEEYRKKRKERRPEKRRERRRKKSEIRHKMLAAMTISGYHLMLLL